MLLKSLILANIKSKLQKKVLFEQYYLSENIDEYLKKVIFSKLLFFLGQ